jgi:hypothetical protein
MYLTKMRFKLAAECPRKLFYAAQPALYADQSSGDPFLEALKAGGFQVGELAKLMFPDGIEVTATGHDRFGLPQSSTTTARSIALGPLAWVHLGSLYLVACAAGHPTCPRRARSSPDPGQERWHQTMKNRILLDRVRIKRGTVQHCRMMNHHNATTKFPVDGPDYPLTSPSLNIN